MNVLVPHTVVEWALTNMLTVVGVLVGLGIALFAIAGLRRRGVPAVSLSPATKGKGKAMLNEAASQWQLLLLGATGLVLSLASGYTTWMGMTNFTGEAVLSLMVTFGIQGVMLIVAWLIGESFAAGMSQTIPGKEQRISSVSDQMIGMILALAVVSIAFYWILHQSGAIGWTRQGAMRDTNWTRFADVAVYFALGLIVLGVLAFNFKRGGDLSLPYVSSARIVVKNAILWVMFLACMGTSVFFSFDSLFGAIFPKDERVRAANLRAQNQVAGIVADIGDTIETRRNAEVTLMFANKGWLQYEQHLAKLTQASQGADKEIEGYFNDQIEERNRAIKQQQERIASANAGGAGLQSKKASLTDELARLKGERPGLAAELTEKKTELENRAKAVDAKRVEAMAEDKGVEGTGKQGRGPMYRLRTDELAKMQEAYKIQEDRVRDATKRIGSVDSRLSQLERELAATDGDLAKLKGESETAEQRIKMTVDSTAGDGRPRIDPARVRPEFERAKNDFRQDPSRERLAVLQQQCANLYTAMMSTPATKAKVRDIDCDPKQAAEAGAVMFALNDGIKTFDKSCAGGDKLAAHKSTDALYGFARTCLADSGLPSKETEQLRNKINFADLSRDDKAHPFVATLNAFQDGNHLAYLALAIAIAMDSLVFMSGLFGANAVRSPLSDVPSLKARSGKHLDAIIENALLPDTFDTARLVLNAMRPMTPHDGFTARVVINDSDPHANDIRRVLNAAATIGAVRQGAVAHGSYGSQPGEQVYEVRSELFEFLSVVSKKAFMANDEHGRLAELRKVVSVALQPHVGDHADLVIQHCEPISEKNGFSAEIYLGKLLPDDAFVVQKALNAGATLNYVQRDADHGASRYYVHKQLYKTLLMISSAYPKTGQRSGLPQLAAPGGPALGGVLTPQTPMLEHRPQPQRRLAPSASDANDDNLTKALAASLAPANVQAANVQPKPAPAAVQDTATDEELRNGYWSRLLRAIGIDAEQANPRLNVPELPEAAQNAWNALNQHGRNNRELAQELRNHQARQEQNLAQAYDEISREIAGSRRRIDILDEVDQMVQSFLPALMMFPENGLIASLVHNLENAAGPDNGLLPGEQPLKDRLKGLQQDLAGRDMESLSTWTRISDWLTDAQQADNGQVVRLPTNTRRRGA